MYPATGLSSPLYSELVKLFLLLINFGVMRGSEMPGGKLITGMQSGDSVRKASLVFCI